MPTTIRPHSIRSLQIVIALAVIASAGTLAWAKGAQGAPADRGSQKYEQWLTREVRHELVQVPWLSVFDNLQYSVKGSEVTLSGQVWPPLPKHDPPKPAKRIAHVTQL